MSTERYRKPTSIVLRDPEGNVVSGHVGKRGRPAGIEKVMKDYVRAQIEDWDGRTLDGWEAMVAMMYDIAMGNKIRGTLDTPVTMKDRMSAVQFLFDRVYGKAKIVVEDHGAKESGMASIDIDALSTKELAALERHVEALHAKVERARSGELPKGTKIIDIRPADPIKEKK